MTVLSVGSEIAQALLPYRKFDEFDILANIIGTTMALPICILVDIFFIRTRQQSGPIGGYRLVPGSGSRMSSDNLTTNSEDLELGEYE
ncbi:hypothetical protein HDU76_013255 [Blyttiomyces sp. JEL0837]|nr:hypothetical protein HDU76_013255 [Blyttiomyces sp. JEL0837]